MPSVPFPFLVALLLLLLLAALARRDGAMSRNRPFLALIATCIVQSSMLGLHWGYGVDQTRYVIPVLAAVVPALVYASFWSLAARDARWRLAAIWPHLVPVAAVILLVASWRAAIDAVLIAIYLGYAAALLRLARSGPDALREALLESTVPAHRALQWAAAVLIASASLDALIALDFEWTHGAHAAPMIAIGNLLGLLILGFAAWIGGRSQPAVEAPETAKPPIPPERQAEDREVVARVEDLMLKQELFRDENLNLSRLARKAGLPARQISAAINRLTAKNVSQYVNDHRIAAACRLLAETEQPVTAIMFEVGFQTKSNFNREFQRVTNSSPSLWRAGHRKAQGS